MLLLTGTAIYAQNDMKARIELENAELAYSENRISDVLEYLNKTQALVGWSRLISYIRILCIDQICNYRDAKDPYLTQLHSELKMYMDYANNYPDRVEPDQFCEIYAVKEKFILHKAEHSQNEKAAREWARISDSEDLPTLQTFIATYADTPLAATAQQRVTQITKRRLDDKAAAEWTRLSNSEDIPTLQTFIKNYGSTPSTASAKQRITQITNAKAVAEWANISTTEDMQTVHAFINKYRGTPAASIAQQRYNELDKRQEVQAKYTLLQKELNEYKRKRSKTITKRVIWGLVGVGSSAVGINCIGNLIDDSSVSEGQFFLNLLGAISGSTFGLVGIGYGFTYGNNYSSAIKRLEGEIDKTRVHLSLQPVIMPVNAYDTGLSTGNKAYGVRVAITF